MLVAIVALVLGGRAPALSGDIANLTVLSIEELDKLLQTSIHDLVGTTADQQKAENDGYALSKKADAFHTEREDIEEAIAELEKSYRRFDKDVEKYNRQCDKSFGEDDPELAKCLTWQTNLKATKEELTDTQIMLTESGEDFDRRLSDLTSRQGELAKQASNYESALLAHMQHIRSIRSELDDRKWFGCADKALCDKVRQVEKCVRVNTLTCRFDCLIAARDDLPRPQCK